MQCWETKKWTLLQQIMQEKSQVAGIVQCNLISKVDSMHV